jgi:hypothetical protein
MLSHTEQRRHKRPNKRAEHSHLPTSAGQHHDAPGAVADDHAAIGTD